MEYWNFYYDDDNSEIIEIEAKTLQEAEDMADADLATRCLDESIFEAYQCITLIKINGEDEIIETVKGCAEYQDFDFDRDCSPSGWEYRI